MAVSLFPDAGISEDQDAFAVNFHQNAMPCDTRRQFSIEGGDQDAHQRGSHLTGHQDRHRILFGILHHLGQRLHIAREDHRRRLKENSFSRRISRKDEESSSK